MATGSTAVNDANNTSHIMELRDETNKQLAGFQSAVSALAKALSPVLEMSSSALDELEPLESSQVQLGIAQAVALLFRMYLQSVGINPPDHPVEITMERLDAYSKRVAHYVAQQELSTTQPSLSVDVAAANRFIKNALPGLSDSQKDKLAQAEKPNMKTGGITKLGMASSTSAEKQSEKSPGKTKRQKRKK